MTDDTPKNIETIAYVVHSPGEDYVLEDVIIDEVRPDELLVDMRYSGLCHTDEVFQQGHIRICEYPAIFGHEGAGTIRAIGSAVKNQDLKVGDAVLCSINYCERCEQCKTGHPANCIEGTRFHLKGVRPSDGETGFTLKRTGEKVRAHFFGHSSFARTSVVQETCVVKFPYPVEQAAVFASMGCGYQTGAGTVLNILRPSPTQSIVIFGMGTVGLTAMMGAKYLKMRQIICVDIQPSKLKVAKELGASDVVNSKEHQDVVQHIKGLLGGGADFCIDCTGVPVVIEQMIQLLGNLGTAATVGVPPTGAKINIDPLQFLLGSKRYIGCREGDSNPPIFIPRLVEMQKDGDFAVEKIVKVFPYQDISKAMHELHEGSIIKPVIQWS